MTTEPIPEQTSQPANYWTFKRVAPDHCQVRDKSGTLYFESFGELAAHQCQDFERWTSLPDRPGGEPKEAFGLKPGPQPKQNTQ